MPLLTRIRTVAEIKEILVSFLAGEMERTATMFDAYPDVYNTKLAHDICGKYTGFLRCTFEDVYGVCNAGAFILLDTGVARAISQVWYCAREELKRTRGDLEYGRDTFLDINELMEEWRPIFKRIDAGGGGNEDLAEVLKNIQEDYNEESDVNNMSRLLNEEEMGE